MELVTLQSQKYVKVTKGWETHHSLDLHLCPLGKSRCLQKDNLSYFYCCIFYSIIVFALLVFSTHFCLPSSYIEMADCFYSSCWSSVTLFCLNLKIQICEKTDSWMKKRWISGKKMRGHSRVGVDGILEEAELCRITHPMNATSNFHTWLTHSFRSSEIVILNSNKFIFLPTRPVHRILAIGCHLLIIKSMA